MPYSCKDDESAARERLRAFWAGSSLDRPALHVTVGNPDANCPAWPADETVSLRNDYDPQWHAWRADCELRSTIYLAEAMPGITLQWGTLLTTLAMLSNGTYTYESDSAWINEISDLWERPLPQFDVASPPAVAMERALRAVAQTVGQRGFVSPPAMLDALTTISSFRKPQRLCMELIERPQDVIRWNDALTDIYVQSFQYYYGVVCDLGYGDTSNWLRLMAEGSFEAVQCDFAVMLSPAMYERFVLPSLIRTVDAMDYALYHLDGTCQLRFLPILREINGLNGIQWNPEPAAGPPTDWLDTFREIRKAGMLLHIVCPSVDEALSLTRALGPDGLYLILPRFGCRDEAERAISNIEDVC